MLIHFWRMHFNKSSMAEWEMDSCIRGYHVYQSVWMPVLGEELICHREPFNSVDRYAVCVKKDDSIIGHLPKNISRICSLFLRRGGSISCIVAGSRRYLSDLSQGGLEIPCSLLFRGKQREVQKLKRFSKIDTVAKDH